MTTPSAPAARCVVLAVIPWWQVKLSVIVLSPLWADRTTMQGFSAPGRPAAMAGVTGPQTSTIPVLMVSVTNLKHGRGDQAAVE